MSTINQKIIYSPTSILQESLNNPDLNRPILEFIDNSLDSAEDYFDHASNSYSKPIEIRISKTKLKSRSGNITIQDNCSGFKKDFNKPFVIFKSDKRNDPKTNGMYGSGMFSFFSICNNLKVKTKTEKSNYYYSFDINKKIFKDSQKGGP
ncbi:MAG: ATP-binding protein [Bacteroidetes bacterium]|nr:ATP-binding protein [Bacteroidota bacterium]